ncbi:MAG TPA: Arm DNA-binding domain-containing protein [Nitrosospira sp.]|nr:Arm DNA-binding domain-containing protein [Nitrosospira sp.]
MKLTDAAVRKSKPEPKPFKMTDGGGLFLSVQPNGSKYWRLAYRFAGKQKLLALGVYPDVPLVLARERRDAARKLLATGVDPSENRRAAKATSTGRAENSFEVVTREWLASHMKSKAASHREKVVRRFELYLFPWLLAGTPEWTVKRNDLKDWAKKKMIRPTFLFPQLPLLDAVRNVASAEAYRVAIHSHGFELEYRRALLGIAQQINNGQLAAYLADSDGEFAKLKGGDALVLQMRAFLFEGMKSEERLKNRFTDDEKYDGNPVSLNMDWAERIHVSPTVACKPSAEPQTVTSLKPSRREAKQDGGARRNILVPSIEKAIRNAGSDEPQAVYLALRELALDGEPPFTGGFEGDALCYTNSENKSDKLTKKALSQRLQRRRAAEGE